MLQLNTYSMNYKLKIHFIIKNFFLRIDSFGLLPNFVKKISLILSEVSNNYSIDRRFNGENMIVHKLNKSNYDIKLFLMLGLTKVFGLNIFINFFEK